MIRHPALGCRTTIGRQPPRASSLLLLAILTAAGFVHGQALTRKATTVGALVAYPVFFHGQAVILRGEVETIDGHTWVFYADEKMRLLGMAGAGSERDQPSEVRGTFWDVGRLEPGDPRLREYDIERLAEAELSKPWPGPGELPVVVADTVERAEAAPAPSIRSLALDPVRYRDQRVTVLGRFRGRNLFGDLPLAPGQSRWDFVLQMADAAIWVTGQRPRGRGFDLNLNARVDSSTWLEATGLVREGKGLVWIDATQLALGKPQETAPVVAVPRVPPGPPPAVIFSAPIADEVDVPPSTNVRIQFSRDMDPASFKARVAARYVARPGEAPGEELATTINYNAGTRVLEIRFDSALERFRVVEVQLGEGIVGIDGQALPPWRLTFAVGS